MRFLLISVIAQAVLLMAVFTEPATALDSTSEQQTALSITVYNDDLGLVKDLRLVPMERGEQQLRFRGVAARIIPESVHIKSMAVHGSLHVIEQNYEYDLLSPKKLLDKYVGRKVKLVTRNPSGGGLVTEEATVLANNNGTVYEIDGEVTFGHEGRVVFPSLPENLIAEPTLVLLVDNSLRDDSQSVEVSYLTRGMGWHADYVLTLNETDEQAAVAGWVTVQNRSGAEYKNAQLKLVAGDVNRVSDTRRYYKTEATPDAMPPGLEEEEFFEYHIYSLKRKTTLKDNQMKQISLLSADLVPVKKRFVYRGGPASIYTTAEAASKGNPTVEVEFMNTADSGLGMALPKGTVRLYKRDGSGALQFIGEDKISHTPADEPVSLTVGKAFDITVERRQSNYKKLSSKSSELSFEVTVHNHKKTLATVYVSDTFFGDWKITRSSHDHVKADARRAEFAVKVSAGLKETLTYTVRIKN